MIRKNLFLIIFLCLITSSKTAFAQISPQLEPAETVTDWTIEKSETPKGRVEAFTVDDHQYNRKRKVWVYTPPDYNARSAEPYRLLISFDGEDYIKDIPAPIILDNLVAAGKIYPLIQVMVDNSEDRLGDLANHQKFADFIGQDLLTWVRQNFHVTTDAHQTVLCGYSAGGLAAAFVAYKYPDLFGNVFSQSGAFWRGSEGGTVDLEWLTAQYKNSPKLKLRFYLEVGGGENQKNAVGLTMINTSEHLRDVLKTKGNEVAYREVPNAGHNTEHWRGQFADGIIYLIKK